MSDNNSTTEMTFLDHLEALRWHLLRSALVIVTLAILAFVFKSIVFDLVIMGPSKSDFFTNKWLCWLSTNSFLHSNILCINTKQMVLQNIQMAGQFTAHIKISLITSLVLGFPYIFFEIWRFIRPALYPKELKTARGAVLAISLLFFIGVLFGYYIICPLSINFLYNYQVTDLAVNNIQLMSYISLIASICLASGVMFELPIVVMFFSRIGLITPEFLKKYRRHAIIVILIVAAIITPPDVFSQMLVTIPLLGLYELSIGLSKRIVRKMKLSEPSDDLTK
jgi:sec-independent protein translocase protein TatC